MSTPATPTPSRGRRRTIASKLVRYYPMSLAVVSGLILFVTNIPFTYVFVMYVGVGCAVLIRYWYETRQEANVRLSKKRMYLHCQLSQLMIAAGFTAPVKLIELAGKLLRESPAQQDFIDILIGVVILLPGLVWHENVRKQMEEANIHLMDRRYK